MNDVNAVAGQLTKLRERLEQKELELGLLAEQSDAERTLAISFINRLTQACRGHDRELDNKLARLRQRFEDQVPLGQLAEEIQAIERLLQHHAVALEESLRVTRDTLKEGGRHLTGTKDIPDKIRKEVREFLNQDQPYAIA